jgi:putative ABC transport system permease protein
MLTDVRHAIRGLRRTLGFTFVAVLTLAVGIGGTSAVFTVVNRILLDPLPFPESDRLVLIWGSKPHEGQPEIPFSQPDFEDLRRQARSFVIRTSGNLLTLSAALRETVRSIDPNQPVGRVAPLSAVIASSVAQPRANRLLLTVFAAVALALSMVGVYGLLTYSVVQRTPELGIRLALGGHPHQVRALILREGLRLVGAGVLLGVIGALLLARTIRGLFLGVEAADPVTFVASVALLAIVAGISSYLPLRRATEVDPIAALRPE